MPGMRPLQISLVDIALIYFVLKLKWRVVERKMLQTMWKKQNVIGTCTMTTWPVQKTKQHLAQHETCETTRRYRQ